MSAISFEETKSSYFLEYLTHDLQYIFGSLLKKNPLLQCSFVILIPLSHRIFVFFNEFFLQQITKKEKSSKRNKIKK